MITIRVDADWQPEVSGTQVRAGRHRLIIDEPKSVGGDEDKGPNPMQYLLAGVGGCLIAMGRLVAKEKGYAVTHIRCRVEGDIDPAGMMEQAPGVRPGLQEIRMTLEVDGPESPERIREWLDITERRCAVRDTVANGTVVKVALKG